MPCAVVARYHGTVIDEASWTMKLRPSARCEHGATFRSSNCLLLWLTEYMACWIGPHVSALVWVVLYSMWMFHIEIVCLVVGHILCSIGRLVDVGLSLGYILVVWADSIIFLIWINQVWSWVALLNSWEEFLACECPTIGWGCHLRCLDHSSNSTLLHQSLTTLSHPIDSGSIDVWDATTSVLVLELALPRIWVVCWL